jgi:hypothetical protein
LASTSPSAERPRLTSILAGAAALAVIVVIAIVVSRSGPESSSAQVELTPQEKEYLAHIRFSDARMSAATNFLGQRVIYLDAQISNQGHRSVKQVEAIMEFTDLLGQVIFREQARIFPPALLPLKSGETRDFQLFFDHIPSEWNQAPPRITVVSVQFE